jgi:4-hydroxy-tetrahydrodipicolinate reductase
MQPKFAPKVALYGLGVVGKICVRLLHEKSWKIVAAYNRAGDKIGQDIGTLSGLGKELGVRVQDYEKADYSQLDADVAVIAGPDYLTDCFPIYERFLNAGVNVLSFGSHAYQPDLFYPELAKKLDELARRNGVTFTGSGLWDSTRIWAGLVAVGPCVTIDSIEFNTDTEALRQGLHWAEKLGMGLTVEEFDRKTGRRVDKDPPSQPWPVGLNHVLQIPSLILLRHIGYTISDVKMYQEPVVFDVPVHAPQLEKEFPAGICVGTRIVVDVQTKEGVSARSRWEYRLFKPGEVEHSTWKINGSPGMEMRVVRNDSGVAQASSLLNRIPDVVRARPGIVTIMEMGPERPSVFS